MLGQKYLQVVPHLKLLIVGRLAVRWLKYVWNLQKLKKDVHLLLICEQRGEIQITRDTI